MVRTWFDWYRIYIKEEAIEIVKDRANHVNDNLISDFWNHYNDYVSVNEKVLELIKILKNNNYKIYLLSNINPYTYNYVKSNGLFNMVDRYVLSYIEHKIKPYESIYKTLIYRYNLNLMLFSKEAYGQKKIEKK